jgi:hypothetical protein
MIKKALKSLRDSGKSTKYSDTLHINSRINQILEEVTYMEHQIYCHFCPMDEQQREAESLERRHSKKTHSLQGNKHKETIA